MSLTRVSFQKVVNVLFASKLRKLVDSRAIYHCAVAVLFTGIADVGCRWLVGWLLAAWCFKVRCSLDVTHTERIFLPFENVPLKVALLDIL